ncbi:unnamed protein product [Phytomonas sp. EM1]|nr:unnamed protein product [Phytomonas sp. EM1]|eukprot:CCW59523.1 unnamed protein product [Phytomonas sp. isolate EM1]
MGNGHGGPFATARLFAEAAAELHGIARRLLPLRLSKGQPLLHRGEVADAVYFIAAGVFSCARAPWRRSFPAASGGLKRRDRDRPFVEVSTLVAGDFCGELELLGYDPDERPGEGVVWGAAYWREALARRLSVAIDPAGALASVCLAGTLEKTDETPSNTEEKEAKTQEMTNETTKDKEEDGYTAVEPEEDAMDDLMEEENEEETNNHGRCEERIFSPGAAEHPRARIATVRAKTPAMVFRLDYDACRVLFSEKTFARLREYVRGYPSNEDLRVVLTAQRKWREYRAKVVEDVLRDVSHTKAKSGRSS